MSTNSTYECYELVKTCRSQGIELSLEADRIKLSGVRAAEHPALLARIRDRRAELIQFLLDEQQLQAQYQRGIATLTRSDFPWAKLSAELLNAPYVQDPATENLYIATPMQAGLIFHGLLDGSGASYTSLTSCNLVGPLDTAVFERAWQHVVRRHDIFRTCFVGLKEKRIHQLVRRDVLLPFVAMDWRDQDPQAHERALRDLHEQEKQRGFDFEQPPLIRLTLVRLAEQHYHFVWAHHHVLLDGWCLPIVFGEVMACYRALRVGSQPALPTPTRYVNYIAWLHRQDEAKARDFWRERLSGVTAPTPLGIDRRAAEADLGEPRSQTLDVSSELTAQLQSRAHATHSTMNSIVQAAWASLLRRYSGESQVTFGATVSGRPAELPGVERMMGLFINTVPVCARFEDELTIGGLLRQLHENTIACEEYSYLGLPEIQQLSEVRGVPLFDSVVVFENYPAAIEADADAAIDIDVRAVHSEDYTNYSLTLLARNRQRLTLEVQYWSHNMADASVRSLLGHLERILLQLARLGPDQLVGSLDLSSESERQTLLVDWNATQAAFSENRCIHELFEECAERDGDAIAIVYDDARVTYAALERRSNQLAHALQERGVKADTLVGLCMERSPEMLVGILGILKAGGAYVALDPEYPRARLQYLLKDAATRIVLTQQRWQQLFSAEEAEVICLDDERWHEQSQRYSEHKVDVPGLTSRHLAYVLYTSGSTGQPKGVLTEHRALVNRLEWMQKHYALRGADKVLQKTPYSFDVSVWELLWPLMAGAQVVFAKPGGHREPAYLRELIIEQGITTVHYVPSMLKVMLETVDVSACRSLRRVFCSGEALGLPLVRAFYERMGAQTQLHNLYGPTEAAIDVTYWDCSEHARVNEIPIGRPIDNLRVYVLDEQLRPQPTGVIGELHIGGVGVARGYLNQPELTAQKFIRDPFVEQADARLYKTGDLVRWTTRGELEFVRRKDEQVKLRGLRIELGEIESQLAGLAGVKSCAVACREQRLIGYVVPNEPLQETDAQSLAVEKNTRTGEYLERLRAVLPEYMVPAVIVFMTALPLSRTGKLDRKALPAPEESDLQKQAYVAPRNDTEAQLCAIWQQVLGLERVGVHDSFFALGGHSLLAVTLVARVTDELKQTLPLKQLFLTPTIEGLAAHLHDQRGGEAVQSLPTIEVDLAHQHEPFALTGVQQAYLLGRSSAFALGNVAAHGYRELNVAALELPRLERAWNRFIRRHGMLRVVFSEDGTQRILPEVPAYRIAYVDLRGQPEHAVAATLQSIRDELSHQVFAVDRWPLFELRVTRVADDHYRLHYSMDLLLIDGSSARILVRELLALYADPACELPTLELSFRDYVLAEQAIHATAIYERSREYWHNRLERLPMAPALPLAKDPGEIREPKFQRRQFRLDAAAWRSLRTRINELGITPTVFLLTLFSQVLSQWSKSPRFTLNLTLFNRLPLHEQVDRLIGDFTSLTLLEIEASSAQSLAQNAKRIQAQLWDDLEHRYYGGVDVLRALNRRSGSHQAVSMPVVFTSALGLARTDAEEQNKLLVAAPSLRAQDFGITQTSQVWLDHQVSDGARGLVLTWDAIEEMFPAGVLDEMFAAYRTLLEGVSAGRVAWEACHRAALPASQRARREAVNATQVARAAGSLHGLFLEQVRQQADAVAIIAGDRRLTYAQVDRLAGGLSHRLHGLGAQPNTLIAIVMEKGWEQIVAALGIVYAGAAYLPIDANLPQQRIERLLALGEVRVAITQRAVRERLQWPSDLEVLTIEQAPQAYYLAEPRAQDLAYVIFTSGSTGEPKGVMIDHRGAVNTILDINGKFAVSSQDRVLALSSLSFDLSVYDVFGVLAAGGSIVVPEAEQEKDPAHWVELVSREGVTLWNSVPVLAQLYVEQVTKSGGQAPSIRLYLLSGDWIALRLPEQLWACSASAQVVSLGGATEASIWSIYYPVQQVAPQWRSIPYGWPLQNQQWHVLKADYSECPDWVVGDLYIGGIGLALGYWRDEERSRARFIEHPRTGERLYQTGDLGRYWADGTIEFLGREDTQVKVHGHRIELGEIEAVLSQHERIKDAIVLAVGANRHHKTLVAYLQPAASAQEGLMDQFGAGEYPLLESADERLLFKLQQPGLRAVAAGSVTIELPARERGTLPLAEEAASTPSLMELRAQLTPVTLNLQQWSDWLSCLAQVPIEGHVIAKRYYPSAGSLYPLQTYLCVREGVLSGVAGGCYYYDPSGHRLVQLQAGARLLQGALQELAFGVFLIADRRAMGPMYGAETLRFCQLEAGHMQQLLLASAGCHGLGVMPVAYDAPGLLQEAFALSNDHVLLQCLVGGGTGRAMALRRTLSCVARQSYRSYLSSAVERSAVEALLQGLSWSEAEPRLYLYSKAGRVQGLQTGFYGYEPTTGTLAAVSAAEAQELRANSGTGVNQHLYAGAAFALFLVGEDQSSQQLLAAGRLGQALMNLAPELGLGLCPIGSRAFTQVGGAQLLYSFEGGGISAEQSHAWPVETKPGDVEGELRAYLSARLPTYMVPSSYVVLNEFPLTANGKVDRKALPAPEESELRQQAYVAPRNDTEAQLCAIWQQVLGLERVGVRDNFFEIGGNSLLAIKVMNLMRERFGQHRAELSLTTLFRQPYPSKLAETLRLQQDIVALSQSKLATAQLVEEELELGEL